MNGGASNRPLRLAAVCGIVMQLGALIGIFRLEDAIPWGWAVAACLGLSALGAALVHAAQSPPRRWFYATVIVSSAMTWALVWGFIGFVAAQLLDAPIFEEAGFVLGPLAGSILGCLIVLRARLASIRVPEILVLGAVAGALLGLGGMLSQFLDAGTIENWPNIVMVFAVLGALGGLACHWAVSRAAVRLTPST